MQIYYVMYISSFAFLCMVKCPDPVSINQECVSSSEDISAKTKSVIELKKLQLQKLQRRLRRCLNTMFDTYFP